jgi:transposase
VILAEDEASLYLQATVSAVWAPRGQRPVVPAHPGREKVNFYGSLNLQTGQEIVSRTETMNAEASAEHLEAILAAIPDRPVLLLWDRAPWHRGQPIRQVLEAHPRLEILLLPVAAPELNPQEHVWKATRQVVSHNHLTPYLPELADKFEHHLTSHTFHSSLLDHYDFNNICMMFN